MPAQVLINAVVLTNPCVGTFPIRQVLRIRILQTNDPLQAACGFRNCATGEETKGSHKPQRAAEMAGNRRKFGGAVFANGGC
jgi:hypothetical protein